MDCNRAPDWSEYDDEDIDGHEGYGRVPAQRQLDAACLNIRDAIEKACLPWGGDGSVERHIPYYGKPSEMLGYYVNYAVRLARKLKLYPETAQLEAETRRAIAA